MTSKVGRKNHPSFAQVVAPPSHPKRGGRRLVSAVREFATCLDTATARWLALVVSLEVGMMVEVVGNHPLSCTGGGEF